MVGHGVSPQKEDYGPGLNDPHPIRVTRSQVDPSAHNDGTMWPRSRALLCASKLSINGLCCPGRAQRTREPCGSPGIAETLCVTHSVDPASSTSFRLLLLFGGLAHPTFRCVQEAFATLFHRATRRMGLACLPVTVGISILLFLSGCGALPPPSSLSALYLFSVLNNRQPIGPQTYTSTSGTDLLPLRKNGRSNIVPYTPGFRDPRLLQVGNRYYYSYTVHRRYSSSIGLIYSSDLQNWTAVTTPNWSSLELGRENAIWNGAWWNNNGQYYMFFGSCEKSASLCTPYFVQFDPASNTFGVPRPMVFIPKAPHNYTIVMSVFQSAGMNWALLQTLDAKGKSVVALASFTSITSPWTSDWSMIGNQPRHKESGAVIVLPNGNLRVYYVETAGGKLFYTNADGNDPSIATWSAPQAIPPFGPSSQPADWVDVVPVSNFQTLRSIANLE